MHFAHAVGPPSPNQGILQSPKIFNDGATERKEVGNMVANVVKEQLKLVTLPDLYSASAESNDSFVSCNETVQEDGRLEVIQSDTEAPKILDVESEKILQDDPTSMSASERINSVTTQGMNLQGETDKPTEKDDSFPILAVDEAEVRNSQEVDLLNDASPISISEQAENDKAQEVDLLNDVSLISISDQAESVHEITPNCTTEQVDTANQEIDQLNETISTAEQAGSMQLHGDFFSNSELSSNNENIGKQDESSIKILEVSHDYLSPEEAVSNLRVDEPISDPSTQTAKSANAEDTSVKSFVNTRKVSAFGSFKEVSDGKGRSTNIMSNLHFGANGEGRRHVLNTMFIKGMRSSNLIARGVAPAARRAVQAMDRKRAQILMNCGKSKNDDNATEEDISTSLNSMSILDESEQEGLPAIPSEEDECIEAIRLVLVQNRVALGKLTPENAALTLNKEALDVTRHGKNSEEDGVDAGEVDERLAGCGPISNAISSAIYLWKEGMVSNGELLELIQKDLQFTKVTIPGKENENILIEDSAFWGRFAFGERWAEKKSRIQSSSTFGAQPGWDLTGVIVKANDDLRQEAFAMQLIELSKEAFEIAGLELWIHPYRILATGKTTGIIEMVRNAMSFDSLKKRPGYNEGGLLGHFTKMAEHAADPKEALLTAKRNFVRSLAAYSLLSHFFLFKDRHNGNLLLDTAGHVIHIDFGFIFGIAPGGSFSLESSVPFKLTEEMIEVMDGLGSTLFSEFVTLFCCGFLAMQAHAETFVTIVKITCEGSTFKCFEGKDIREIVAKLRERFCPELNKEATIAHAMELIRQATNALGTKQYDFFQYLSQGIAA